MELFEPLQGALRIAGFQMEEPVSAQLPDGEVLLGLIAPSLQKLHADDHGDTYPQSRIVPCPVECR